MTATFLVATLTLEGSGEARPEWLPQSPSGSFSTPGGSPPAKDPFQTQDEESCVHVGGQVRRTGPVQFKDGMTAGQAIEAAGGETEFGFLKRVEILRHGKIITIDLTTPEGRDFRLKNSDTITVPERSCWCR